MSTPVLISIIVPVYGVEKYIAEFSRSVFGQSYPHIQYIFVNDGTKDRSIEIVKEVLEKEYPHRQEQVVFVDKENGGLPAARKTGLEYVKGDYVYNVDPDDWLSDGSIAKIAEAITATGCDIIYFNYVKEYQNRSSRKCEREYGISEKDRYVRNMYNHKSYGTLCNKCIRYSLYSDNDLFYPDYGYAEDCCMSVQLVGLAKSIAYINEDVYHYRKGDPHAMTRQGIKKRKKEYIMNFLSLYEKYRNVPVISNPIASIMNDILMQAAWYSCLYGFRLFEEYPYLACELRKVKVRTGSEVPMLLQCFLKIVSFLKCKK